MHPVEDAEAQKTEDPDEPLVIRKMDNNKGYRPVDLNDPSGGPGNSNECSGVVNSEISIRYVSKDNGQPQKKHRQVEPLTSNSEHQCRSNSPSPSHSPQNQLWEQKKRNSSDINTKDLVEVNCGKRVTCECIKSFIVHSCSWLSKSDLDSLHVAIAEIEAIKPRSVLKNCQLKILAATSSDRNINFYSGKGKNKFMVVCNSAGGSPTFVTRTCPRAAFRRGVLNFQYLKWLNVIRVILSAVAFLYVLFWIFDQLHAELPIEGCLDLKVKMHDNLGTGIGNLIPVSQRYCSAPKQQLEKEDESNMSPVPQAPFLLNALSSLFGPKSS